MLSIFSSNMLVWSCYLCSVVTIFISTKTVSLFETSSYKVCYINKDSYIVLILPLYKFCYNKMIEINDTTNLSDLNFNNPLIIFWQTALWVPYLLTFLGSLSYIQSSPLLFLLINPKHWTTCILYISKFCTRYNSGHELPHPSTVH